MTLIFDAFFLDDLRNTKEIKTVFSVFSNVVHER